MTHSALNQVSVRPDREVIAATIANVEKGLLIDGAIRAARSGRTMTVENPASEETLCEVADAGSDDALDALEAAVAAEETWRAAPPRERSDILRRAYGLMVDRAVELSLLITMEMGKSLAESRAEVEYAAGYFRWFAEQAVRIDGDWKVSEDGSARVLVTHQPVGPSLLITPWNVPLTMPARKVAPAIAAGCTMVVKPAQQTPLSMLALASILTEAGLPPGVLNVVTGSDAAAITRPLIRDPRLRKISFTGSTAVGRLLIAESATNVLRLSMELGGNAPFIVCQDADLDRAVDGAVLAKMRNLGEACVAANRFYVHAAVVEEFTERLTSRLGAMTVGPGYEPDTDVGPLIDASQRYKVEQLVDDAVERGAEVRIGGALPSGPGYFYPPTVLTGVDPASRLVQEEIFGPVAAIQSFTDERHVLRAANQTDAGLVAYLFTRELDRAVSLIEQLEYGMVGLNRGYVSDPSAPFGGIKQSGFGREGGNAGIQEYLDLKYVAIDVPGGGAE